MPLDYLPVFMQIVAAVGFAGLALIASVILGQRGKHPPEKDPSSKGGQNPIGPASTRFSVKFYLIAMLFTLFEIETVFFYLWAVVYREQLHEGLGILYAMLVFIGILAVGLAYEIKKKALDWS
jgi:NADH-quinone oxidoreductase subunit A